MSLSSLLVSAFITSLLLIVTSNWLDVKILWYYLFNFPFFFLLQYIFFMLRKMSEPIVSLAGTFLTKPLQNYTLFLCENPYKTCYSELLNFKQRQRTVREWLEDPKNCQRATFGLLSKAFNLYRPIYTWHVTLHAQGKAVAIWVALCIIRMH